MSYIDETGCSWDSYESYVIIGICGICGCANDEIRADVIDTMKRLEDIETAYMDDKYHELILHILDNKGIAEHGTSVRGSWLTDYGRSLLEKLKEEEKNAIS